MPQETFSPALLGLAVFAIALRNWPAFVVVCALIGNWILNTGVCWLTGDAYPWAWFLAVDYLTGFTLLLICQPTSLWCASIVVLFSLECVAHAAYGMSRHDLWAQYSYWHTLSYAAWAQAAIVGGWGVVDLCRRWSRHLRGSAPPVASLGRRDGSGDGA